MALHLVTGYNGSPHITSANDGALNAGCFGSSDYVLKVGKMFEAQLVSSNTVRILDGSLSMQGRHMNLESGTFQDLTINDGVQGMNRYDLIVAQYSKSAVTGYEQATLVVVQGTATDGTPIDPFYVTGDILNGETGRQMPLYRVKLSGVTIESVEPMFTVLAPISDIQHGFYKQNMLINGDFQINQRGNKTYDVGNTSAYSVDMWRVHQIRLDVLNEGVKITGRSTTATGYFTQFIQLGKLKTVTYTISAMVDGEICTFTVTPGADAKEKDFGKFKISALTTSIWDNALNDYNNKLKINICPVKTNSIVLTYVDVFEGNIAYPHVKEDPATALMRCKRYVQQIAYSSPTLYMYTSESKYAYRFAITHDHMHNTPTVESCSWSYYNTTGETTSGGIDEITVVGNNNNIVQLRTEYKEQKNEQCNAVRGICLLTCEPTDA